MAKSGSFRVGDLVVTPKQKGIVFQVVAVQVGGDKCIVGEFDVSHQKLTGSPHTSANDLRTFTPAIAVNTLQ